MNNVMTNGFCELNENEMMMVDGGRDYWGIVGGVGMIVASAGLSVICPAAAPALSTTAGMGFMWVVDSWNC